MIQSIPWVRPYFNYDVSTLEQIRLLLDSGQITNNGDYHKMAQRRCEIYFGTSAQLVSSGSMALQIAVDSLKHKKKIILPAFTFNATLSAVLNNQCKPIFCDIDKKTWQIDLNHLEYLLKKNKNISAVIPVNCFGLPVDLSAVYQLTQENCKIIYDDAHGFGSEVRGQLHQADVPHIRVISLHATKIIPAIEGGLVLSNSNKKMKRISQLANHGFAADWRDNRKGYNARLDEIRCLLFLKQMDHLEKILLKRRQYTSLLREQAEKFSNFYTNQEHPFYLKSCNSNFCVTIKNANTDSKIFEIMEKFSQEGVQTRQYFFPPLHQLNFFRNRIKLPNTDWVGSRILSLPLHSEMSPLQLQILTEAMGRVALDCA